MLLEKVWEILDPWFDEIDGDLPVIQFAIDGSPIIEVSDGAWDWPKPKYSAPQSRKVRVAPPRIAAVGDMAPEMPRAPWHDADKAEVANLINLALSRVFSASDDPEDAEARFADEASEPIRSPHVDSVLGEIIDAFWNLWNIYELQPPDLSVHPASAAVETEIMRRWRAYTWKLHEHRWTYTHRVRYVVKPRRTGSAQGSH